MWHSERQRHHRPPCASFSNVRLLVNLTLKNIPDEVYALLKAAAEAHRRSLNSEAIVCLESALLLGRLSVSERLQRARQFRARLSQERFRASDIDSFKMEGRR